MAINRRAIGNGVKSKHDALKTNKIKSDLISKKILKLTA